MTFDDAQIMVINSAERARAVATSRALCSMRNVMHVQKSKLWICEVYVGKSDGSAERFLSSHVRIVGARGIRGVVAMAI